MIGTEPETLHAMLREYLGHFPSLLEIALLYLIYLGALPVFMFARHLPAWCSETRRGRESLGMNLQTLVSHYVGAGR